MQTYLPHCPRGRDLACLVVVAHQGPAAVLGTQEAIHQHGPPEREMELDVFLKVSTQLVTVEVVAEGEALPRDQHVDLTPQRHRKEGFQAVCQEGEWGESTSAPLCATPVPSQLRPRTLTVLPGNQAWMSGPVGPECRTQGRQARSPRGTQTEAWIKEQATLSACDSPTW